MEKVYALGLTKKEYYKQWEQEHRQQRNAYRRKKYKNKIIQELNKGEMYGKINNVEKNNQ